MKGGRALVLLSGGQDSTTCFYGALQQYEEVEALSFDYGQRHRVELELAELTAKKNDVHLTLLPVEVLSLLGSASLTNPDIGNVTPGPAANVYAEARGLPPSFVPGRNSIFFSVAAAYAVTRGIERIVTGVCQQDHAGYPDCRAVFVEQKQRELRLALDAPDFIIDAPLLWLSKADTWALADSLGIVDEIVLHTHTCYEGDRSSAPAPWGYGCGECGACVERKLGYDRWRARQGAAAV
jgi:7-cyano-7-deazaguanine synthase